MSADFKNVMYQKSDEELIKIVSTERNKYQEDALIAADEEFLRRGIDINQISETTVKFKIDAERVNETQIKSASRLLRFLNFIIDIIIIYTFAIIYMLVIFIVISFFKTIEEDGILEKVISIFLFFATFLFYYIFLETKFQKTIGKFITKTIVVKVNGEKPNLNEIVKRSLARFIPFDNVSFLGKSSGFHDSLSKTIVIKDN